MSTHADRTEAPAAREKTAIERVEDHARDCAWRASLVAERDRRERCAAKGLPLSFDIDGPMLARNAEEHAFLERCRQTAEALRNRLLRDRDAGLARARNARR